MGWEWELVLKSEEELEIFYPDAGSYTVQHRVSGIGGTTATETQTVMLKLQTH